MNEDAFRYCRDALPGVSRTFALGIALLDDPLRDEIGIAYLICRILDTIEDTTSLPAVDRVALLERAARELTDPERHHRCGRDIEAMFADRSLDGSDQDLCRHASTVLEAFHRLRGETIEGMRESIREMAEGMAGTVRRETGCEGLHLETMADLERYCYYVAGTVGKLLTNLFILDRPAIAEEAKTTLRRNAVRFGLGLQVTNIIKGVTDDIARGVSYLPRSLFKQAGIDLQTVVANPGDPRGRRVVAGLVEEVLTWLDDALAYTLAIPATERDIRLFCALPLAFAVRTLGLAVRTDDAFSERKLKITRMEVAAIRGRLEASIGDDEKLTSLYRRERDSVLAEIHSLRS